MVETWHVDGTYPKKISAVKKCKDKKVQVSEQPKDDLKMRYHCEAEKKS